LYQCDTWLTCIPDSNLHRVTIVYPVMHPNGVVRHHIIYLKRWFVCTPIFRWLMFWQYFCFAFCDFIDFALIGQM